MHGIYYIGNHRRAGGRKPVGEDVMNKLLILYVNTNRSVDDIAEDCGISKHTAYQIIHQARNPLLCNNPVPNVIPEGLDMIRYGSHA